MAQAVSDVYGSVVAGAFYAGRVAPVAPPVEETPATSIAVTDFTDQRVFQRVGASRSITVSGTYGGSPSGIRARAVPHGTAVTSTAYPWTTITTSPSGGIFSASLTVATGGWYNIQVSDTAASQFASGVNRWGVGAIVALIGQSNCEYVFKVNSAYPSGGTRSIAYYAGAYTRIGNIADGSPEGTSTLLVSYTPGPPGIRGDALVYMANRLASAINAPVCFLPYAVSGSAISTWLPATGANWATFATAANAVGSDFEAAVWLQGETDAGSSMATYKTNLALVQAGLLALNGRTTSTFSMAIVPIGPCTTSWRAEGTFGLVRTAHLEYVAANSGSYILNTALDATLGDGVVHWDVPSYVRQGRRWAEWIIRNAAGTPSTMQGPTITSASRSGTTVTVTIAHHGGTALQDGAGGTSGTSLAGFRVFDGGTPMTISSTAIASSTTVTLTLSATPAGTVTLDFGMENAPFTSTTPSAASVLCDNQSISGDARGIPLQPSALITVT